MDDSCARRVEALLAYQIIDSPAEASFDDIAKLASDLCKSRFAAISFIEPRRQWFKAAVGLSVRETPISQSFCAHAVAQGSPLIITDARNDARFCENELVKSAPHLRFYAGFPLLASDGIALGALCVMDDRPRPDGLSASEMSAMAILADQVEAQLELRRAIIERDAQVERLSALALDLRHLAGHDTLTALPNRSFFVKMLDTAIEDSIQSGASLALMLVDVDHFKQVNDSVGHDAGDALLRSFAANLRSVIRTSDTVARIGGDEFAVLMVNTDPAGHSVKKVLRALELRLAKPTLHRGRSLAVQASIGLAVYPKDASSAEGLVKCSDLALAEAKTTRNRAVSFAPHLRDDFEQRHLLAARVETSLAAGELSPFYQPKVNLDSGSIIGFEALMRRHRDGRTLAVPNVFDADFPDPRLAAKVGLELTNRILDDMKCWVSADVPFGHIAINSCAADFAGDNFAENLLNALAKRCLPASLVELEVTEGVFVGRGASHVARALNLLSEAGVRIALDDFGTGYASLSHLKQFPVNVLKIDRSFVSGIGRSIDDAAIVRAVIGLGRNLGIETVAEGIETREQEAFVRLHGCDVGQGYLYGAAVPAGRILERAPLQFAKRAA